MGVVEYSIAQVDQMILLERVFFAIAFSVGAGLLIGMEFARIVSHHSMDPGELPIRADVVFGVGNPVLPV